MDLVCRSNTRVLRRASIRPHSSWLPPRLLNLLQLLSHDRGGQGQVSPFPLNALLSFLAEDEMQELVDLWIHRFAGVAVEIEEAVVRQGIGIVAHRVERSLHEGAAIAPLNRKLFQVRGKRQRRR